MTLMMTLAMTLMMKPAVGLCLPHGAEVFCARRLRNFSQLPDMIWTSDTISTHLIITTIKIIVIILNKIRPSAQDWPDDGSALLNGKLLAGLPVVDDDRHLALSYQAAHWSDDLDENRKHLLIFRCSAPADNAD